jgi:hypothetical protein
VNYYLGFDPGGNSVFGWAVAKSEDSDSLEVVASGCADHALEALEEALSLLPLASDPVAAGIDAPLFWTPTGVRHVDERVRAVLRRQGARSPGGTVQQLNSLRGACLVQGVTTATLLRQRLPNILLTETHPKALLWYLELAHRDRPIEEVRASELPGVRLAQELRQEHERDAVVSCYAAWSLHTRKPGWRDLELGEPDVIHVVPGRVSYWMPDVTDDATTPPSDR